MVPYRLIAGCFAESPQVVPFLGSAASSVGAQNGPALPMGSQLAREFADFSAYPGNDPTDLPKVAQYLEEVQADRALLRGQLGRVFGAGPTTDYSSAVSRFFHALPVRLLPQLIVTTNYDLLVEQVLLERQVPFLAVSHILRGTRASGRLLVYDSLKGVLGQETIMTRDEVDRLILDRRRSGDAPRIVYKMHGTAVAEVVATEPEWDIDTYVVTEDDYVEFLARDFLGQMPAAILTQIRRSRLLFLGYSLRDWNTRVLLRRIRIIQRDFGSDETRHWACVGAAEDSVDVQFWSSRKVTLYEIDLSEFMEELLAATGGES